MIRGMKSEYLQKILPYITVSPLQGYNVLTMSKVMLVATLNCTLQEAEQLVNIRRGKGFFNQSDIQAVLGEMTPVNINGLGFPSKIVRITIEGVVGDARNVIQGEVSFIADQYGPFRVLTWRDGA